MTSGASVRQHGRAVEIWLLAMTGLVAATVVVGGLTRLTGSGLSITRWDLFIGAIPPLGRADWEEAFRLYRQIPEFREVNSWMTLGDFQVIYWWEWSHRLIGRLVGLAYGLPFAFFLLKGGVPREIRGRLWLLLALGGLQGAVGWWMVQSGLVDRVDVSPYRLAIHLGLAFVIMGLLLDSALRVRRPVTDIVLLNPFLGLALLQILFGAFVAGIGAGRVYVDWPLMNGAVLPPESFDLRPLWRNLFENHALVQFVHRGMAYGLVALAVLIAVRGGAHVRARCGILAVTLLQATMGIVALRAGGDSILLASLHQAGAVLLFLTAVWARRAGAVRWAEGSVRRFA